MTSIQDISKIPKCPICGSIVRVQCDDCNTFICDPDDRGESENLNNDEIHEFYITIEGIINTTHNPLCKQSKEYIY